MGDVILVDDLCYENARDVSVFSSDLCDSMMDEGFNTVNYGFQILMSVGHTVGKDAEEKRIIFLSDLQNAIPANGVITAAELWLYITLNSCIENVVYGWQIFHCTRYGAYLDSTANLDGGVEDDDGEIDVTSGAPFLEDDLIRIDDEILYVEYDPIGDVLRVARGWDGTTPAAHSNGADIYLRNGWREGYVTWDNYKKNVPWTVPGGDYAGAATVPTLGYADGTGWWSTDITALAQDARANRDDILNLLFLRSDALEDAGVVTFYTKEAGVVGGPHVRITYTLDDKVHHVLVFNSGLIVNYQALDGAVTFTGDLATEYTPGTVKKVLEGAVTFSGTVIKKSFKPFSGAITFSGHLSKLFPKSLAGALTLVGDLAAEYTPGLIQKALGGTLTFTGTITKKPRKLLSGTFTSSGLLNRLSAKGLAGALAFTGSLTNFPKKALTGSISFVGTVRKTTPKMLSGAITFSGTLRKFPKKLLAGSLTLAGTLARISKKRIAGSLTLSGTLVKKPFITRTGELTFAGSVAKRLTKVLAGSVTFSGTMLKKRVVKLVGAIAFAGRLRISLPVMIAMTLILYSGALTSVQKGATLSLAALSGVRDLVIMVLSYSLKRLSGTASVSKADHPLELDLVLYSGQQELKKETQE